MAEKTFSTAEKFLIIAHHPEKGRFILSQIYIQYGIAGAILLDMALEGRITIEDGRLILKTGKIQKDTVKSELVELMSKSTRTRKSDYWVRKLAGRYSRYKIQILKGLEEKNIMRIEERKFLGIIPYKKSYLNDGYTRTRLISQLKNEILGYKGLSGDNMALAGLVEACRMDKILTSDREELKVIRSQVKKIIKESPMGDVIAQTIKGVQIAIMAGVTAATAAATARSH